MLSYLPWVLVLLVGCWVVAFSFFSFFIEEREIVLVNGSDHIMGCGEFFDHDRTFGPKLHLHSISSITGRLTLSPCRLNSALSPAPHAVVSPVPRKVAQQWKLNYATLCWKHSFPRSKRSSSIIAKAHTIGT